MGLIAPAGNGMAWWRLLVSQVPWVVATLVGFGWAWSNVDARLKAIEETTAEIRQTQQRFVTRDLLDVLKANADKEHATTERRIDRLERRGAIYGRE